MNIDLDHKNKYVLGVSGGSDSMALLSLCTQERLQMVVCFVNYKLRESADKEEEIVKQYCQQHCIKLFCLYPKQMVKENFQKWARQARYEFFKDVYQQEQCDYLLLAHQLDDHLENYLMAKQRHSVGWFYGISKSINIDGMNVLRPLLSYRKSQLRQYCLDNKIVYHDDESNFTDKYTRNKIRHQLVETASAEQIKEWLQEIDTYNQTIEKKLDYINDKYSDDNINLVDYQQENKEIRQIILRYKMYLFEPSYSCSGDFVDSIDQQLMTSKHHFRIVLDDDMALYCEYGLFYIYKIKEDYTYKIDHFDYISGKYFKLASQGSTIQCLNVSENDWPLTIRNAHKDDEIQLRFGSKKINRFFIDRKILTKYRMVWPLIVNNNNKVIFVSKLGCDLQHYSENANLFMIELI